MRSGFGCENLVVCGGGFYFVFFFFFQAEDGIRDYKVTGVQTCALPISSLFFLAHCPRKNNEALKVFKGEPARTF